MSTQEITVKTTAYLEVGKDFQELLGIEYCPNSQVEIEVETKALVTYEGAFDYDVSILSQEVVLDDGARKALPHRLFSDDQIRVINEIHEEIGDMLAVRYRYFKENQA